MQLSITMPCLLLLLCVRFMCREFTINIMSEWFVEVCPGRGAPSLAAYPDFRLASSCMGLPNIVVCSARGSSRACRC